MLTPQQIEIRRTRVTGSTVAAFLGLNPYASPSQAWSDHLGITQVEETPRMRLANAIEPGLCQEAAIRLGAREYIYPCGTLIHREHPWWAATPDALSPDLSLGIQVKVQGWHMANGYQGKPGDRGSVDNDLIPVYHHMQCQWEMGVAGFRRWVLAVYFGGDEFRLYRIERNDLMLAMMRRRAHEFWRRHLDPSGPLLRPDDAHWQPHIGVRDARKPKLTGDALLNAPIPGASHG